MGLVEQALIAFKEFFTLRELFPDSSTARAYQTNICNRLVITVLEDIDVANLALVNAVLRLRFEDTKRANSRPISGPLKWPRVPKNRACPAISGTLLLRLRMMKSAPK